MIADGRKRFAAALSLGARRVPCVTCPTPLVFEDDLLIAKLRSEQLSFFECADVLSVLTGSYLYSQEEIAAALNRSQSFVANRLRLLAFSAEERAIIEGAALTERHCRAVLRIKDPEVRRRALGIVASSSMTVGATEDLVSTVAASGMSDGARLKRDLDSLIASWSDSLDVSSSSSVSSDGAVVYTIKIPR